MASWSFPTLVTGVTVETTSPVSGDGTSGDKLTVSVDGTTIDTNVSHQLQIVGGWIPPDQSLNTTDSPTFGGLAVGTAFSAGDINLTASGAINLVSGLDPVRIFGQLEFDGDNAYITLNSTGGPTATLSAFQLSVLTAYIDTINPDTGATLTLNGLVFDGAGGMSADGTNLILSTSGDVVLTPAGVLHLNNIPASDAGLSAGDVYQTAGVLMIKL